MKAVIYSRYDAYESPDDSIKRQLSDCYEYAQENELEIVDEYTDLAPGCMERGCRPGLELLLEDSKKDPLILLLWQRCRACRIAILK